MFGIFLECRTWMNLSIIKFHFQSFEWCNRKAIALLSSIMSLNSDAATTIQKSKIEKFSFFPVDHSNNRQLWAFLSSSMWRRAHSAFISMCYAALWFSMASYIQGHSLPLKCIIINKEYSHIYRGEMLSELRGVGCLLIGRHNGSDLCDHYVQIKLCI